MTEGLQLFNDGLTTQLSDNRPTLVLKQKGTHSTTTGATTAPVGSRSKLTLSGVTTKAVVAIRPAQSSSGLTKFAFYEYAFSGSTLVISIFCNVTGTQSFDWWLFDAPDSSNVQNFGLEVLDTGGNVMYHSYAKPLRVISYIATNTSEAQDAFSVADSGMVLASVQGGLAGYRAWDAGANGNLNKYWQQSRWTGVGRDASGLVYRNELMDRDTANIRDDPLSSTVFNPRNFLIANVTGY